MGIIKFVLILLANLTIIVVGIRFVSIILERLGVFAAMERLFGKPQYTKRNDDIIIIQKDEDENNDI